ncbi:hypothetical protein [Agrobacterium sp. CG674]
MNCRTRSPSECQCKIELRPDLAQASWQAPALNNAFTQELYHPIMETLRNSHASTRKSPEESIGDTLGTEGGKHLIGTQDVGSCHEFKAREALAGDLDCLAFVDYGSSVQRNGDRQRGGLTVVKRHLRRSTHEAFEQLLSLFIKRQELQQSFLNEALGQLAIVPSIDAIKNEFIAYDITGA